MYEEILIELAAIGVSIQAGVALYFMLDIMHREAKEG